MALGTIGSFEVIASLGSGARGSVYRARHATFGRIAAIKHLSASVAPDSAEYQRLLQEVERLKSLQAPNVAAIMSVELVDGRPLIEMESLGEGLDRALRQQPLDSREALRVVMDMLSGLRDMHAAGIVHANLKPANVLQDTTNRSWKISDGGLTGIESHTAPTLLATSVIYVAPEMIAEVPRSDERSDLYSLGMVGLEAMLGGELLDAFPNLARSATPSRWLSWLEDTETDAVRLHELRPEVPVEVSEFFARLLVKNPERRFQSAVAALDAMEAMLPIVAATQPVPAPRAVDIPAVRPTPIPPSLATPTPAPVSTPAPTLIGTPAPSSRPWSVPIPAPGATPGPRTTPAPKAASSGTRLVVTGPKGFEERFALGDRTLRIGRDAKNDITLPDDTKAISRVHAEIRREQGRYVMVDLESQNGLWVGGRRKSSIQLATGVAIKIGGYILTVGGDAVARPAAAAGPTGPATATTLADRTRAALTHLGAMARISWPPSPRQWAVIGAIAVVLVAGVTWAAWPKGPNIEEITRRQQDEERLRVEQQAKDQRVQQEKLRLQKEQEAAARQNALDAAKSHLDKKEWQSAIDVVAGLPPTDEDAEAIRKAAELGLKEASVTRATETSATGSKGRQTGSAGVQDRPIQTVSPQQQRSAKLFEEAKATSDPEQALGLWQRLRQEDRSYNAAEVTAAIDRLRRQIIEGLIAEAQKLEPGGDLVGAQRLYQRAAEIDKDWPELQGTMRALAARIESVGQQALAEAKRREQFTTRKDEARALYLKASIYLQPNTQGWKDAMAGLDRLKKQI